MNRLDYYEVRQQGPLADVTSGDHRRVSRSLGTEAGGGRLLFSGTALALFVLKHLLDDVLPWPGQGVMVACGIPPPLSPSRSADVPRHIYPVVASNDTQLY